MNEKEEEQVNEIRKDLAILMNTISHSCIFFAINLKTTHDDTVHAQYDNVEDFKDANDLQYLAYNWMRFNQLNENKSVLFTYWVTKPNLEEVREQSIFILTKILEFDQTNNWQAQLLTAETEPYIMQSIFLTNNDYPQLVIPGLSCSKVGFEKTFNANMPDYFKQFNDFYYLWQKDNYWHYYQKELVNLDQKVDTSQLKEPIANLFDDAIFTLHNKARKRYDISADNNQPPITYLTLANLVQNQTAINKNLKQIKNKQHYQPLVNYLTRELNA